MLVTVSVTVAVTVTVTVVTLIVIIFIVIIMVFFADTLIDRDAAVVCAADARTDARDGRIATTPNHSNRPNLRDEDAIEPRIGRH